MRTIRTPEKASTFLQLLRETGGNVTKSCEAANIGKRSAYDWRNDDPAFAEKWDEAVETGVEELEQEARRRAFEGVDEPVFYKGEVCGMVRKYSDLLLIFMLKANKPEKYRENIRVSVPDLDAAIERQLARVATGSQGEVSGQADSERVN